MNRGRFDEKRGERDNTNNRYGYGDNRRDARPQEPARGSFSSQDRRPDIKREFNDREMDRPGNRSDRTRDRSEHEQRSRNDRDAKRSPPRSLERPRSPMRSNPFRRNKNQSEEQSDFRHDGQKADRNDRSDRNDRHDRNDRNDRSDRSERNEKPERKERFAKNGSENRRRFNNKESDNENYEWGKPGNSTKKEDEKEQSGSPKEKEKPNFGLSGKLTEDANKVNGVVVKYAEPPEARRPTKRKWRLYPFKNDQSLNTIHIHRQSCFLIGRDKKVCEIAVDHPSCSKQHAALQYRLVNYEREDGVAARRVRPYIIDLESANGTFVNNKKIEPRKYFELFEKDVLKFGFSSREYVLLHEDSNVDDDEPIYNDEDDDNKDEVKTEKEK